MDSDAPEPEMRSDCSNNFWKGLSDSQIDRICRAPQQYSSATISSIEALDKEKEALQNALNSVLNTLRKRQAAAERETAQAIAAIHHRRNALIPMARLPPEILARILVLHAQMEPPD
ncbi:hypothetical protein BD779DRAFT_1679524 [Infundibulicybe gibba]|nr:hypothetical protein BD779DRAFT_1679524 [Infundibulicybe gibba]